MTVRSVPHEDGRQPDAETAGPIRNDGSTTARGSGSLMRVARLLMRRKPVVILLILTVCLVLTVLYSWDQVRNGEISGVVLVGANLCAFVIALVYLADDFLRR